MKNKILQLIIIGLIGIVLIMSFGLNNISQASNATKLQSISIEQGKTLEQDSENSMIYRTEVENTVNSIKVNVVPYDSNSKITIEGNENLEVGTNKVNIKVTSQNGESANYIIYVRRLSSENTETIIPNVQENSAEETKNDKQVNNEQETQSSNDKKIINEIINENETNEETVQQVNQENTNIEELNNENEVVNESLNNIEDKKNNTNNTWFFIIIICIIAIVVILIINRNRYKRKH